MSVSHKKRPGSSPSPSCEDAVRRALCHPRRQLSPDTQPYRHLDLGLLASQTVRNSAVDVAQTTASVSGRRADYDRAQAWSKHRAGMWGATRPPSFCLLSRLLLKLSCPNPVCSNRWETCWERGAAVCSRCVTVSGPHTRRWEGTRGCSV